MGSQTDAGVAIVGSGIIGTVAALVLAQAGFDVVAIDPNDPGAGTAAGSAGYLHDGEIFPVAKLSLLPQLPRMLLDPYGPLVVRASYLPQMAGWGLRFLRAMRRSEIHRAIDALASLNRTSVDELWSVAQSAGAEHFIVRRGGLKVVGNRRELDGVASELLALRSAGIPAFALDASEARKIEPSLSADIAGAISFPTSAHCSDPARFGAQLAAHVRARARVVRGRVVGISQRGTAWDVRVASDGSQSVISADRVLLASGVVSADLLRPLGYNVPVASARGYHLMISEPGIEIEHPMIFHEPHVAATPMDEGLRLAGTVEFASPDAPPDFRRATMLYSLAKHYLPDLKNGQATTWMGVRSSMPDSLPAIGRAARHKNLYYCFGHGHLGFTQSAMSSRLISELMSESAPSIDVAPFDLARFK